MKSIILTQRDDAVRNRLKTVLREALTKKQEQSFSIVEITNESAILSAAKKLPESIVVLDFNAEEVQGIRYLVNLLHMKLSINLLVIHKNIAPQLIHCLLQNDVRGHLACNFQFVDQAVMGLAQRCHYLSPKVVDCFVDWHKTSSGNFIQNLSLIDSLLMYFIAESRSSQEMCFALNIAKRTLERRLKNLYRKLFIKNIKELRVLSRSFLFRHDV